MPDIWISFLFLFFCIPATMLSNEFILCRNLNVLVSFGYCCFGLQINVLFGVNKPFCSWLKMALNGIHSSLEVSVNIELCSAWGARSTFCIVDSLFGCLYFLKNDTRTLNTPLCFCSNASAFLLFALARSSS